MAPTRQHYITYNQLNNLLKETIGKVVRFNTAGLFCVGLCVIVVYADKPGTFDASKENIRRVTADKRDQLLQKVVRKLDHSTRIYSSQPR